MSAACISPSSYEYALLKAEQSGDWVKTFRGTI